MGSFLALSGAINGANYVSSPASYPSPQGYVTYASTSGNTITLYPEFSTLGVEAAGQTLVHEAVHMTSILTDQQLGHAVTGNVYAGNDAGKAAGSAAFNKGLDTHCK